MVYGAVFLLVGLAGFIPGITTNYSAMQFAGHESEAMLLGVFQVSMLHNIVHLFYGIAGVAMTWSRAGARNYLLWGEVIYLVLWIYGLLIDQESEANFVPLNTADDWLHLFLGLTVVALSFLPRDTSNRSRNRHPLNFHRSTWMGVSELSTTDGGSPVGKQGEPPSVVGKAMPWTVWYFRAWVTTVGKGNGKARG